MKKSLRWYVFVPPFLIVALIIWKYTIAELKQKAYENLSVGYPVCALCGGWIRTILSMDVLYSYR